MICDSNDVYVAPPYNSGLFPCRDFFWGGSATHATISTDPNNNHVHAQVCASHGGLPAVAGAGDGLTTILFWQ